MVLDRKNVKLSILMALTLAACGGEDDNQAQRSACALETRADTFVQDIEKTGETLVVRLVEGQPVPPEVGNNTWSFEILDGVAPVTTATISVKPWMPDHGQGTTPLFLDATYSEESGHYLLDAMDLFMPGYWTFTFEIEHQSIREEVVFGFCLEG